MRLDSLGRDLVYAFRQMRRTPVVAAAVISSAAIGIAANTTIFSAVKAVLLGTLAVSQPDRLFTVFAGPGMRPVSYPAYTAHRDSGAFEHLAAFFPIVPASLNDGGEPERLWGQIGTANYFEAMRVPFAAGRGFRLDEENAHVVVLSHSLWVRRFKADPTVIGREVNINRGLYTVVGVTQRGFHGSIRGLLSEFWVPLGMHQEILPAGASEQNSKMTSVDHSWLILTGRLQEGVDRDRAQTILNTVDRRLRIERKLDPDRRDPLYLETAGGIPVALKQAGLMLGILMAVSAMVLLIACANIANLLLARALARQREMSVRLAIGASRGRLVRQLLTESVVLALLGAFGGLVLTWWAASGLQTITLPIPLPLGLDFRPDLRVLAFGIALSIATGILFGLAPALKGTRSLWGGMKKDDTAAFGSLRRWSLSQVLVAGQVTLTVLLLIGCGLFVRSLDKSTSVALGFDSSNVLLAAVDPQVHGYTAQQTKALLADIRSRMMSLPGVESVAFSDKVPLTLIGSSRGAHGPDERTATVGMYGVTPGFFSTMRIPLVAGQDFPDSIPAGRNLIIVNAEAARLLFGNRNPVGSTMRMGETSYEVVAVAANIKDRMISESPQPLIYEPLSQTSNDASAFVGIQLLIRTSKQLPAEALAPAMRQEIQAIDRNLAVFSVSTMTEQVSRALLLPRTAATLFGVFGATGLVLSTVGLFGLMSYTVRRRTREIGIRIALGADPGRVLRLVSRQGLVITGAGLAVGGALSLGASRVLASFLFGVDARDVLVFAAVPLLFLAVALAAILLPAWRAARVNPLVALRYD
jgi:predicted permease